MKFLATLLALAASVLPAESLTASEGEAFGKSILSAMTKTLATGSMEKMADEYFADEIEWIWSGPQVGKGHKSKLVAEFAGSWGAMVSAFNPAPSTMTIVDTPAKQDLCRF